MLVKKLFDIKYGVKKSRIDKIIDNSFVNEILKIWKKIKSIINTYKKSKITKE